jgi:hypothetical protein
VVFVFIYFLKKIICAFHVEALPGAIADAVVVPFVAHAVAFLAVVCVVAVLLFALVNFFVAVLLQLVDGHYSLRLVVLLQRVDLHCYELPVGSLQLAD